MDPNQFSPDLAPSKDPDDVQTVEDARRLLSTTIPPNTSNEDVLAADYGGVSMKFLIWWNKYSVVFAGIAIALSVIWMFIWLWVEGASFSNGHVWSFIGWLVLFIVSIFIFVVYKRKME
jgi:hypothetical protein